ncbi:hypothetical protein PSHT_07978 [Puccinia striiformis]|uniref:Uncharacterized protein n=1 Tax=Puccinia striiformis TaxID=27350 RepID=A0A2S4VTM6_9BASI|nr:hypothetical protein PSHT_07978 [Puccinia striiformis]
MQVWRKNVFLCLVWYVLGPGRLVLARLDGAARASTSLEHLDSSKPILFNALDPPAKNDLDLTQYDQIPKKTAKRKGGPLQVLE